jgi:hypothetical protein
VGFFRRRPKVGTTRHVDEFGEMSLTVDRSGNAKITLSPKLAVGALLGTTIEQRGPDHPETLELAHRYAQILVGDPKDRQQGIELFEWLADAVRDDPKRRRRVLDELGRARRARRSP